MWLGWQHPPAKPQSGVTRGDRQTQDTTVLPPPPQALPPYHLAHYCSTGLSHRHSSRGTVALSALLFGLSTKFVLFRSAAGRCIVCPGQPCFQHSYSWKRKAPLHLLAASLATSPDKTAKQPATGRSTLSNSLFPNQRNCLHLKVSADFLSFPQVLYHIFSVHQLP